MMIIITLRKSLIYKENNADFYEFALFFISFMEKHSFSFKDKSIFTRISSYDFKKFKKIRTNLSNLFQVILKEEKSSYLIFLLIQKIT